MFDTEVTKPATVSGYAVHRMVEGLTGGARPLYADMGDRIILRTAEPLDGSKPVRTFAAGDLVAFTLRAIACNRVKGQRRWFDRGDWRSRNEWLKARIAGAEIITVHSSTAMLAGKPSTADERLVATDFAGVLRVTDPVAFAQLLAGGIGSGKPFGAGMVIV